ncbi:hypothetical protein EN749_34125, partial [Mesorhizobium sp. M7A.F.Ca.ET.027.02.1.1]|uniref:hypothetical protein n=1 Tax=Mesorhizobium sp. M7A.F.Ca.ET.027.02.1.1 TaxID=2496655 RepID=UPI000FD5C265
MFKEAMVAVEWTITIEGKNEFGNVCRGQVRIGKSWERLFDGEIGFSIEEGKKVMATLQSAVVNHEAATDQAMPELMELTARLGSMMPYRQAANVLAEFLPLNRPRACDRAQTHHQDLRAARRPHRAGNRAREVSNRWPRPARNAASRDRCKGSSSASIRLMSA